MTGAPGQVTARPAPLEGAAAARERKPAATPAEERAPAVEAPENGPLSRAAGSPAEFPLRELSIRMDPESKRVVVKVLDAKTGEVVRQIPPEELARLDRELGPRPGRLVEREA